MYNCITANDQLALIVVKFYFLFINLQFFVSCNDH